MESKFCQRCQALKAVTNFSARSASKDGLQPYCKDCNRTNNTKYRIENPTFFKDWYNRTEENRTKAKFNTKKSHNRFGAGVYMIVNTVEDKMYIGATNQLARRWMEHRNQMVLGSISSGIVTLYKDMTRLGIDNFAFVILELIPSKDQQELFTRENYWMKLFTEKKNTLYNVNIGNSKYSKYYKANYSPENL